jgi:hypothetical protein
MTSSYALQRTPAATRRSQSPATQMAARPAHTPSGSVLTPTPRWDPAQHHSQTVQSVQLVAHGQLPMAEQSLQWELQEALRVQHELDQVG